MQHYQNHEKSPVDAAGKHCVFCERKSNGTSIPIHYSCHDIRVEACQECARSKGDSELFSWLARSDDYEPHVAVCTRNENLFNLELQAKRKGMGRDVYEGRLRSESYTQPHQPLLRDQSVKECTLVAKAEDDPEEDARAVIEIAQAEAYMASKTRKQSLSRK
jgi:hypothetical protein